MPARGYVCDEQRPITALDAYNHHPVNRPEQARARRTGVLAEHERSVVATLAAVDHIAADMANQLSSRLDAQLLGTEPAQVKRLGQRLRSYDQRVLAPMGPDCGSRNCRLSLDMQSQQCPAGPWSTGPVVPPGPRCKCPPRWEWAERNSLRALERSARDSFPPQPGQVGLSRGVEPVPVEDRLRLAAYRAKYTKNSSDARDALDHRLARGELASLNLGQHLRRLVRTACEIGGERALKWYRFRQWARTPGSRGQGLTKNPCWSTTLSAPHQRRLDYDGRPAGHVDELAIELWAHSRTGHRNEGDAWLEDANYKNCRLNRCTRREEE